ncbi:MAG: tetratricopeptide repeat protein [Ignavibacteria bacterium]|jgi:tetratricopeptide (TPR) repeat protein
MLKLTLKLFLSFALIFSLASCSKKAKTEDEYLSSAKTLYDSAVVKKDNALFTESINAYKDFVKNYPNSEKVVFAHLQVAKIYDENLNNYPEAIKSYTEIIDKFPTTKDAKQSMFLVAFIYDEKIKDKENAINAYKKFIEKYPQDTDPNEKLSESAKIMLQTLESGTSIEDIIKKIETNESKDTKKDEGKNEDPKKDAPPVKLQKVDDGTTDNPDVKK